MTHHAHENCDCDETPADRRKLAELRDAVITEARRLHESGALLPVALSTAIGALRGFVPGQRPDKRFEPKPRKKRSDRCNAATTDSAGMARLCRLPAQHKGQHVSTADGYSEVYWS